MSDGAQQRWLTFSVRTLMACVACAALLLGLWTNWEYIPGTAYRDEWGYAHGTGTLPVRYVNGKVMYDEYFRNGILRRAKWYRPDGSVVVSSEVHTENGGYFYLLNQDGTINRKMHVKYSPMHRTCVAHGSMIDYDADGAVMKISEWRNGQELLGHDPRP